MIFQRPLHTTQSTIVKPWSKIAQTAALNESDLQLKELEDFLWPMKDQTALFSAKTCLTQIFLLRKEFLVNYVCFSIGVNDRAQFCCASCLLNIVYGWSWLYTLLLLRIWMTIGRFRRFLCLFWSNIVVLLDIILFVLLRVYKELLQFEQRLQHYCEAPLFTTDDDKHL